MLVVDAGLPAEFGGADLFHYFDGKVILNSQAREEEKCERDQKHVKMHSDLITLCHGVTEDISVVDLLARLFIKLKAFDSVKEKPFANLLILKQSLHVV